MSNIEIATEGAIKKVCKLFLWLPLLLVVVNMQSCKSRKGTGEFPRNYADPKFVMEKVTENRADFEWMSARMKVSYDDGNQNLTSPGHLRMRKDSIIWISVTPVLGIEAVRVLITTDSVHVLNRLDRTYKVYPISIAKQYTGTDEVNFQTLQDVLIGNSILPLTTDFQASIEEKLIMLEKSGRLEKETLHVSPDNFRIISTQIVRSHKNQHATILYSDHQEVNGRQLPRKISVNAAAPVKVNIGVEYNKITLNQAETINFQVPTNYERN